MSLAADRLDSDWEGRIQMRRSALFMLGSALILLGTQLVAQQTTFRSGVDLVALSVVVTDGRDKFVSGLSAEDFAILEDGVPQQVSFFSAAAVSMDLALLLDTSASMIDKMNVVHEAATGFVSSAKPGDRVTIVDIKDGVRVLHPLNEDLDGARAAIRSTSARGGTALYNGLYMTLKEMVKQRRSNDEVRRQAILVLSDGDDNASLVGFDDVMDEAKQSGIAIYTITLKTALQRLLAYDKNAAVSGEYAMRTLAQETGARAFFPAQAAELVGVYGLIAEELASQYTLGYISTNSVRDGAYRRVSVRVTQPDVRTRTRTGYVATVTHPNATR
jgi:Ca-activated chloride channel family protein